MSPKVFIITIDEPLYTTAFYDNVFSSIKEHVIGLTLLSPLKAINLTPCRCKGLFQSIIIRYKYYGVICGIRFSLLYFYHQLLDIFFNVGFISTPHSVKSLATKYKIDTFMCPGHNINAPEYLKVIKNIKPDIIICGFSQKAGIDLLSIPSLGCLNIHYSLLPIGRGREPLFWTMLNKHTPGITIYKMNSEYDSGNLIVQVPFSLEGINTLHKAIRKAYNISAVLLIDVINQITKEGSFSSMLKINTNGILANKWPSKEDIFNFRRNGFRFI